MSRLRSVIVLIRVRQWIKNLFVLAPLVFSFHLFDPSPVLRSLIAFASFCLVSSSVYVMNDVIDLERDRRHPTKRNRPLAGGLLSVPSALVIGFLLLSSGFGLSTLAGGELTAVLVGYFILNVAYSLALKTVVILDVMLIAFGFLLRVAAGAVAIGVGLSNWMLLAMLFLALFLGFCKRRKELVVNGEEKPFRRVLEKYSIPFLDNLILASTTLTIITYCLYVIDPRSVERIGTDLLILTIPFVVFGLFRYLYMVDTGEKGEDPVDALLTDPALVLDGVLWAVVTIGILYFSRPNTVP